MTTFWDNRYNTKEFVYGKQANTFFASELNKMTPGTLLLPGEGEGRNAIHAASAGWLVDAFDQSRIAADKALAFAAEKGVSLDYRVSGIEGYYFKPDYYDAIGLIFLHTNPAERELLHRQVARALKPGGSVFLEAFHASQLGSSSGGPASAELLFSEETILSDFAELEVKVLEHVNVTLEEGSFHQGNAELIRFVGRKLNK